MPRIGFSRLAFFYKKTIGLQIVNKTNRMIDNEIMKQKLAPLLEYCFQYAA